MIQARDPDTNSKRKHNNIHLEIPNRYDSNYIKINTPNRNDARAVATLAPAQSVRAPPSSHRLITRPDTGSGSGISTQPSARSLEEWEVEDFVLLATVDGDLYASDRQTGTVRWHLEVDQPMVETIHHRLNTSELDDDHHPVDHYVWAVEPTRDGSLYIWMPGAPDPAILPTGLTMKSLVEELSPLANDNPPVIYTGTKKTTMITLDAATGRVLKWFGSTGSHVNEEESCLRPNDFYDLDREECSSTGTITLGRTEYEVAINRKDGHAIANLRYAEWTPNNFDRDLMATYSRTLDNRYHSSRHDGGVYAFNLDLDERLIFAYKFDSPVARVFDVCRPWGITPDQNPDLLALPQPIPAPQNDDAARLRRSHVFLNQTGAGSWYALSGLSYPLIVDAPPALTSLQQWLEIDRPWNLLTPNQKSAAMIGRHSFDSVRERGGQYYPPTLPGGSISQPVDDPENESTLPTPMPDDMDGPTIVAKVRSIPQQAANSFVDLFKNPVLISILVLSFFFYHKDVIRWSKAKSRKFLLQQEEPSEADDLDTAELTPEASVHDGVSALAPRAEDERGENAKQQQQEVKPSASQDDKPAVPDHAENGTAAKDHPGPVDAVKGQDPSQSTSTTPPPGSADAPAEPAAKPDSENAPAPPEKKKGKAHRGRRGGVKHRKNGAKRREMSVSRDDEPAGGTTVEDAVKNAKKLGNSPKLEPDVVTISSDMQSVTGPVFKLGNIEVDMENQLGTGSNGTLVFAGRFDGRDVAVKRMLIQFYDIASQETRLLRESDDHPNVIRYYAQEARDGFLYIALERCAASLADVVERPSRFHELAQAGRADLPAVLYQIANGINHLHSLRIVHRDLKPQNILVNMDKGGRPRLLVSDFGLCKKLEGGQSSFGATTGRAAGTTGWRAPELLLDDDKDPLTDASINSGSGTPLVNSELLPNRRATRSIDIFSLGLVFFYVLSNGQHPFDCGDRYMREVNIRKDNYNLSPLSVLGDFAEEAKDLIGSMLNRVPKQRPTTHDVMSHPFFWSPKKRLAFLCDVSDHFEKEPRDPPSGPLLKLEADAPVVTKGDFLRHLPREFVDSLGKQRKYTGTRLLDLLRALRNKKNHYEDMSDSLKRTVGPLPEGYLSFWTVRFPGLLLVCWYVVREVGWADADRFKEYYEPAGL
ncbi:hypothetical protein ACRALDRAFT_1029021 [Sodiomyces alcalophilus JCM 7366]|uniref:uncharacterized protein n=1 Tax=Sodiomyces alcalophilus JCM 7366 TaxID=591952 RepID=UPI0039B4563E